MVAQILVYAIKAYQFISRALRLTTCRFHPSCSQYAIEAIAQHGSWKGCKLAIGRILRCSPLSPGGYDPVEHPTAVNQLR